MFRSSGLPVEKFADTAAASLLIKEFHKAFVQNQQDPMFLAVV